MNKTLEDRITDLERIVQQNRSDYDLHLLYGSLGSAAATALFLVVIVYLAVGG